ncbi:MAG TPA: SDR family oxidoreductase [Dehalococcoidia bacterium]|nr:SDR family oxidoreductase [Dehalococcoidia bacterium]
MTRPRAGSATQIGQRALVTGASSGIGAAFAERLAADGFNLIVVARRRARLEALARRLRKAHGVEVDVLVADLTRPPALAPVERTLRRRGVELLVNCAGFGGYMPFVRLPADRAEALVRLHVVASTRLTRAALPAMIARGSGAVINVASALAFSASDPAAYLPDRAVYAAAKSYMVTFTELLSHELHGSGVKMQALCPGIVRTEFHKVAGFDVSRVPIAMSAEDVVQASLAGLRAGDVICIPALDRPSTVAAFQEKRARLFHAAGSGTLAKRYRRRPSGAPP